MTARAQIAAALSTVEGITGRAYEPGNKAPGFGWPVLRAVTADGTLCAPYRRTYDVFVLVNNNHADASVDAVEDLIEQVIEVLDPLGEFVEAAPALIQFDDNATAPGIRVQIITDAEEA